MDDYYELLGIDAGADEDEVHRAWRKLALRWHPDRAGPDTTFIFQKLLAAYTVLSDPDARAAYDRQRGGPARGARVGDGEDPGAPPAAGRRRAPGVMLQRLCGSLNALLGCGVARRVAGDDSVIELFVNAEEAAEGGMVTISMRVPVRCPACEGETARASACVPCGASGTLEEPFSAWLAVRPGVAEGTVLIPSAMLPGMIRPVSFRVRLRGAT
jgi:molecular chaperone DnaJ